MLNQTDEFPIDQDPRYLAMVARDARFDGRFFTGVTTTGIYCRPVCRVKQPRRSSCVFFDLAAQAEAAGFRPCMRCRPELAPRSVAGLGSGAWSHTDASRTLALQAMAMLDNTEFGADALTPGVLAQRVGVSDRHLRRIFEAQFGVSPLQYLQTRRLLAAKALLTDTNLSVAQVAASSGFASVRRFNDAFAAAYRMAPTRLRKEGATASDEQAICSLRLGYRPPLDVASLLHFFKTRQIDGIESIATDPMNSGTKSTICIKNPHSTVLKPLADLVGWVTLRFDEPRRFVVLRMSPNLQLVLPDVVLRVRAWLDLDADPLAIDAVMGADFAGRSGLRVPGGLDGFALAVRAILGQQVTVAAGRTFTQRVVSRFGRAVETPFAELNRVFPTAAELARVPPESFGELGIVKQRQAALIGLARAVESGELVLKPSSPPQATMQILTGIAGIGEWTANYIAMRALRWPDAWPAGDVALQRALGMSDDARAKPMAAKAECERLSTKWRPWRAYAVVRAWDTLS